MKKIIKEMSDTIQGQERSIDQLAFTFFFFSLFLLALDILFFLFVSLFVNYQNPMFFVLYRLSFFIFIFNVVLMVGSLFVLYNNDQKKE